MSTLTRRFGQLAFAVALASVAVMTGGANADADPPRAWTGGTEADFGSVRWVHQGSYAGATGNWHLGELTIEEDDDILTGSITDWRCPQGEAPPDPLVWPTPPTGCTVTGLTWISQLDPWDIARFDHATNRLTLKGDFDVLDAADEVVRTAPIDLTIAGVGAPQVSRWKADDGSSLDYEELWATTRAWGRVDGHRVSGPKVTQVSTSLSFYIYGMTRAG